MFFPHLGGAWGSGDIPRRHPEKTAYSQFVALLWDNHHVGQPFRVLNYSDKSVLQKIIDLGLDDQVAIWMKAPHFLSDRLGGWGDIL